MPQVFKIGPYIVYFWSNENEPLEPIHVHIAEGRASANATKIWITSTGKTIVSNNNTHIPDRVLLGIQRIIEGNIQSIEKQWIEHFGAISYYC